MSTNTSSDFRQNTEAYQYIVGIGASAGGLEALQKLLEALPSDSGFPYIIIQHLSPDYKSLLSEILSKYTDMPVVQVENETRIRPNHVYVIPPKNNMVLKNGCLNLIEHVQGELNLPIDIFFRSLAEEAGPYAISVILSGTGSDGANGIKAIKENDGMIMVQDPESAKFDGMPKSALRTGLVDVNLPPEGIAVELQHIAFSSRKKELPFISEKQIDQELMKKIYYILKKVSGVNFTHYKLSTILRRIERRMVITHKDDLAEYVDFLYANLEEVKILSKEVLIGVTNFFRDPEFFQCLKEKVIKNIVLYSSSEETIRIWVAGCSTGEEAYSIAILFCEVMDALNVKRNIKIFATDLDTEAVAIAGKGVYSESIINSVSAERLSRYFVHKRGTFTVSRDIRRMIVFSPHNVFQDPPFGKLDLISCRNMLIYFQPVLQNDLFAIFHSALKDGGYLFLGKSEAIGAYTEAYPVVDAVSKIFSHRRDAKISGSKRIPYLQSPLASDDYYNVSDSDGEIKYSEEKSDAVNEAAINSSLLERFMPACLVVNEKNEIIHTFGNNSNYIHFSTGKVSLQLFDIITESLKIPASTLLKESREKNAMVQYKDILFTGELDDSIINLIAMPVSHKIEGAYSYFALIFLETSRNVDTGDAISYEIDRMASQRITDLEQELGAAHEMLSKSVSEQEYVNEELQATNEELLTANEELQSSNEELQSVNEELYTVNSEYQIKLAELADMNDDIANFLASTLIGIIFVDNQLCIRRFTNYVMSEFNVMDQDVGRSLRSISYHFTHIDITHVCNTVLQTLIPDEREITTVKNKTFFMRVSPYRTTENNILGCVITLVDITTQKEGQVMLQSTEKLLSMAQQANEAKSDFLSRMSHEIRTPMNTISGLSQLAKHQIGDKEALTDSLKKISDTITYMTSIVSDILEMSKIEHSEIELAYEPFDLREIIDIIISMISPQLEASGVTFSLSVPDNFKSAYIGDKTRLQQILLNFLTNAVKYTPRGGSVKLEIYEEVTVGNQCSVCFVISDTGIGMAKDFIPEIFKPFSRENKDDLYESSSMGLGLSIAYNLISLMDGDVQVESEEGKGSTFTIHVLLDTPPDLNAPPVIKGEADQQLSCDLAGCHVLVAEDNDINRKILCTFLSRYGITFVEACNGEDAIHAYITSPEKTFSCILMDMRMPKIDGITATIVIRESAKSDSKTIPIIGVSANAFADDIKKASIAGMNSYITKPIDTAKLLSTIQVLCKKS